MRKTKIICTLGPSTEDDQILEQLMKEGMNVCRLNFSHGDYDSHLKTINRIKDMRRKLDLPIAILLDTKGPEIRLTDFKDGKITLKPGQKFTLTTTECLGDETRVGITYKNLVNDVTEGSTILIDDGLVAMKVLKVTDTDIECEVINEGQISNHKGVNVPNVDLTMDFLSEKDKKDIEFGIKNNIDFIAASFVRCADDVRQIKEILKRHERTDIKIISKIENRQGVNNIDEILSESDGIMVARGDMGVELPIKEVPAIQKMIISKVYHAGKIVITATQMLDSMMRNPRPTRAEASDVANAIYDGTSAIMLSGETAAGQYPIEALRTMVEIAEYTENNINYESRFRKLDKSDKMTVTDAISHATCMMSLDVDASSIITVTKSGTTARMISRYRPQCPIIGCTPVIKSFYQMGLSWGVEPVMIYEETSTEELFAEAVDKTKRKGLVKDGETVVLTAGIPLGQPGTTNLIRVMEA